MKKIFFFFLGCMLVINGFSQKTLKIKGCIRDMPYAKIYLGSIYGGKMTYIDSTLAGNGCFDFYVSDSLDAGLYNIVMNRQTNSYMRIIINKEPIEFNSVFSQLLDSMNFSRSVENKLYYDYTKLAQNARDKKDLLTKLLTLYPEGSTFAKTIRTEIEQADVAPEKYAVEIFLKYPHSYAAAYIKALQPVQPPPGLNHDVYLKQHFLDNVDFSSSALLRSDVLTASILNYLSSVESNTNTYHEQVHAYAEALDNIMNKTQNNKEVYDHYLKELSDRYRYGNYDILGDYLTEYYQVPKTGDTARFEEDAESRLAKLKTITVGKKAPEIIMPTYDGKNTGLKDIQADYTLLVFWSTDCFHCTEMLPALKQVYEKRKGSSLEVLAVSIDTNQAEWEAFIKKGNYSWMNYSDLLGFNSEIAKNYSIHGTPTYFLLNRDKMVIYKPATYEELISRLKYLNLI